MISLYCRYSDILLQTYSFFNVWNPFVWLRITDEGSLPEMRIWSILLIKSDLKWCIHLSRSLFSYLYPSMQSKYKLLCNGIIFYFSCWRVNNDGIRHNDYGSHDRRRHDNGNDHDHCSLSTKRTARRERCGSGVRTTYESSSSNSCADIVRSFCTVIIRTIVQQVLIATQC